MSRQKEISWCWVINPCPWELKGLLPTCAASVMPGGGGEGVGLCREACGTGRAWREKHFAGSYPCKMLCVKQQSRAVALPQVRVQLPAQQSITDVPPSPILRALHNPQMHIFSSSLSERRTCSSWLFGKGCSWVVGMEKVSMSSFHVSLQLTGEGVMEVLFATPCPTEWGCVLL